VGRKFCISNSHHAPWGEMCSAVEGAELQLLVSEKEKLLKEQVSVGDLRRRGGTKREPVRIDLPYPLASEGGGRKELCERRARRNTLAHGPGRRQEGCDFKKNGKGS